MAYEKTWRNKFTSLQIHYFLNNLDKRFSVSPENVGERRENSIASAHPYIDSLGGFSPLLYAFLY